MTPSLLTPRGGNDMAKAMGTDLSAEASRAKDAPHLHQPRLVLSSDVTGEGVLDRIADVVNRLIGSMWLFVGISVGIVVWLFAGNIVGFDKTPWPLLLTILNLPQLSIMVSLQVTPGRWRTTPRWSRCTSSPRNRSRSSTVRTRCSPSWKTPS
jgi:hypothetical protein